MQTEKYGDNFNQIKRNEIINLLSKRIGPIKALEIYPTQKNVNGIVSTKQKKLFFKIRKLNESKEEVRNYYNINSIYPVPLLRDNIKFGGRGINIYSYEKSIENKGGLFLDYLNKPTLNKKRLKNLIKLYRYAFKISNKYCSKYPSEKYFGQRVKPRIIDGLFKDRRLAKILDYNVIINRKRYVNTTREIIEKTVKYFKKNHKELCFMSQGDPITMNLGTKPVLFDFETSGLNPLIAEFSIFFWAVFIAESYYYPKYNKKSYVNRPWFFENCHNKPNVRFKVNNQNKTLDITLKYNLSKTKRNIIEYYLHNFIERVANGKSNKLLDKMRHFLPMRILATFEMDRYSLEDAVSSIGFLNVLCNQKVSGRSNMKENIMSALKGNLT